MKEAHFIAISIIVFVVLLLVAISFDDSNTDGKNDIIDITSTSIKNDSVFIEWLPISEEDNISYNILYGKSMEKLDLVGIVNSSANNYRVFVATGTSYYFKISAISEFGMEISTSIVKIDVPFSKPILLSPINTQQQSNLSPLLEWDSSSQATNYSVQISTDQYFSNVIENATTKSHTFLCHSKLKEGSTYYWRVRAGNDIKYMSPWNETSFNTVADSFIRSYGWFYGNKEFKVSIRIPLENYLDSIKDNNQNPENFSMYIKSMDPTIYNLTDQMKRISAAEGFDEIEQTNFFLAFVNEAIRYRSDEDSKLSADYWRYPIETLVEQIGDCECTSILFASMMITANNNSDLIIVNYQYDHTLVGVYLKEDLENGQYWMVGDKKYYACETTGEQDSFIVGELDGSYKNKRPFIYPVVIHST